MKCIRIAFFLASFIGFAACTTSTKVKSGSDAFYQKRYSVATEMLEDEFAKAKDNASKAQMSLLIAQSLDYQNKFEASEKWYAIYREISTASDAPILYARSLMRNEKFEEAQKIIKEYLAINRQDRLLYGPLLTTCETVIKEGKDNSKEVDIQLLPFNSANADFDPILLGDSVIFSSTRPKNESDDTQEEWMGESYTSLWKSALNSENASLHSLFNDNHHIASLTFTADGKTAYFTQCGNDNPDSNDYCGIYRIKMDRMGVWGEREKISFFGDSCNNGQPFITPDGTQLYFSSDVSFGYGGKDIYVATLQKDQTFTEPMNLGARVNTTFNELFPSLSSDGNVLYYSSDNYQGFGGLDIFKASRSGKMFVNPERLPYGINTGRDDFGLKFIPHNQSDTTIIWKALLSSNRSGGIGNDDIYQATLKKVPPKPLPPAVLLFEGYAEENIYAEENNPNSKITGQKPLPFPNAVLSGMNLTSDKDGFFSAPLDSGLAYNLKVNKEGYLSAQVSFSTINIQTKPGDTLIFRQKVILNKIFRNVEIVLDNIYYDFNKWDIREDARPTLDSLTQILMQNPSISIELASHTDCRGNDEYNMTLSQKRAESVVQYLISKGIDAGRLTAKGYGESMPVEVCECTACTEEQHQRNRRTTFKILQE